MSTITEKIPEKKPQRDNMLHVAAECCPDISLCGLPLKGTIMGWTSDVTLIKADCIVCVELANHADHCPHCGDSMWENVDV